MCIPVCTQKNFQTHVCLCFEARLTYTVHIGTLALPGNHHFTLKLQTRMFVWHLNPKNCTTPLGDEPCQGTDLTKETIKSGRNKQWGRGNGGKNLLFAVAWVRYWNCPWGITKIYLKMRPENVMQSPQNVNGANNFGEHTKCEVPCL